MKYALLVLTLLAGCAVQKDAPASGFRNPDAFIGATSRYDATRFAGPWIVRGGFGPDLPARVALVDSTGGTAFEVCESGASCQPLWLAETVGQGRYVLRRADGSTRDLWVLWVDEGFRTAVIGNPAGDLGWILDRAPQGGADRIAAAQEILDFNGYDLSQLRMRK